MKHKFYSLVKQENKAVMDIFGDVSSSWWSDGVSAKGFKEELDDLGEIDEISVNINSYGGEVADGLAIYNVLRNHNAKVTTHVSGFACSIASVIFMAGDVRVMNESSLLMIHNAWTWASGNAAELRKQADDLETITEASIKAYMSRVGIEESEVRELMDAESWISPEDALEKGFATAIERFETEQPSQNARKKVQQMILRAYQLEDDEEEEIDLEDDEQDEETEETDDTDTEETEEDPEEGGEADPEDENEKQSAKMAAFFAAIIK